MYSSEARPVFVSTPGTTGFAVRGVFKGRFSSLACLNEENYSIIRKSDFTVTDTIPEEKIKNFHWMYIKSGRLYTYYKIFNHIDVRFCDEILIDFKLSDEVLKSAEKYAAETEEQLRLMKHLHPIINPQDIRLEGIFDADGKIINHEQLNEYRELCLIDCNNKESKLCTMCGNPLDAGYSTFDSSKLICRKCYNDFKNMMYFSYVKELTDISMAVQKIEETTSKYKRVECGFEEIQHMFYYVCSEHIDSVKYYKTTIPFNFFRQFRREDCTDREKYYDIKLTLCSYHEHDSRICYELYFRAPERGGDKCFVYQPMAEKYFNNDIYKALIRNLTDELEENPFTDVLTDYEIITTETYSSRE